MVAKQANVNRSVARTAASLMAASIFIGLWPSALPASAEPNFDNGVEMYNKKDYRKAAVYFGQAIRLNPSDPNPIYYHALSCQALGDKPSAIRDYASIVSHFPGSQAGQLAATALQRLDPSYLRQLQRSSGAGGPPGSPTNGGSGQRMTSAHASMRNYGGGSSGGSSGGSEAGLPESSTVYFTPSQGENPLLMVPATINGRPLQMCFDTGAHGVVVGKNHLADMNIPPPSGPPTGQAGGVGSSSPSAVWDMNATVKVGEISRNIPVTVYESMSAPPLLGQNFFSAFTYEIDNGAHSIRFRKKSSGIYGGNYGTGVPFERDPHNPNHQIVTALVNGHPMKMFFDTGAQGVVFTFAQAKAAGLHIPEDATAETSMGVGGATAGVSFPIESLRMGPISKQNFRISVIQNATMPFPLMGQSFFNDYTTYVDESQNRILFKRAQ